MTEAERQECICLLWLIQCLGTQQAWRVYQTFGSGQKVYQAAGTEQERLRFLRPRQLELLQQRNLAKAENLLRNCEHKGIRLVCWDAKEYPKPLRGLQDPPLVLYVLGELPDLNQHFLVSFAGSRRANEYGCRCAAQIAGEVAAGGGLVVSGVVDGCDANAIRGALQAGGKVGAVLAGGVDVLFYQTDECRDLYRAIVKNGFLLSECPPGTPHSGSLFRTRNRILTGLADTVVCVQAGQRSGTLKVAELAEAQGRPLFAIPSPIDAPEGMGTNELIRSGKARMLTNARQILQLSEDNYPGLLASSYPAGRNERGRMNRSQAEYQLKAIYEYQTGRSIWRAGERPEKTFQPPAQQVRPPQQPKNFTPKPEKTEKEVDRTRKSAYIDLETMRKTCTEQEVRCYEALANGPMQVDELELRLEMDSTELNTAVTMLMLKGYVVELAEETIGRA